MRSIFVPSSAASPPALVDVATEPAGRRQRRKSGEGWKVGKRVGETVGLVVGFLVGFFVVGLLVGVFVVGLAVVGFFVVGESVVGFAVVGLAVVGESVVGFAVVGLAVVGFAVGECVPGIIHIHTTFSVLLQHVLNPPRKSGSVTDAEPYAPCVGQAVATQSLQLSLATAPVSEQPV
jgi:hypothetical protein